MDDAAMLIELEAIKAVKARYCRYLDTQDWDSWRTLFGDDFHSDTSQAGGTVIDGADDFVAFTRRSLRGNQTVHQVHAPEIELISPTTATGVWALEDVVRLAPGLTLRAYGHYRESYAKVDGRWVITESTLTRLREDIVTGPFSVFLSPRLKRIGAAVVRRARVAP